MSEPLHVAFVWHMHQPYYRSAARAPSTCPGRGCTRSRTTSTWSVRWHRFPDLHQTFNLVPSLVEQLEAYASGDFSDVYWDHTLRPAADLDEAERAFIVERMCERPDHPRARAFPRYLELARKRESCCSLGWGECGRAFSVEELRDLQVWFNLAWFDPQSLETQPLAGLVGKGRGFEETDKGIVAEAQRSILASTLPTYREAARRGQIELTTSPYFHPILPLLCNTDSARFGAPDAILPPRRFAHPEDAREQIRLALDKHACVFGETPAGMWCSEQAVGEEMLPLLLQAGVRWTVSDETVLARSLGGSAPIDLASMSRALPPCDLPTGATTTPLGATDLYRPYLWSGRGRRWPSSSGTTPSPTSWASPTSLGFPRRGERPVAQAPRDTRQPRAAAAGAGRRSSARHHCPRWRERLGVLSARWPGLPRTPVRGSGCGRFPAVRHCLGALGRTPGEEAPGVAPYGFVDRRRPPHVEWRSRTQRRLGSPPFGSGPRCFTPVGRRCQYRVRPTGGGVAAHPGSRG